MDARYYRFNYPHADALNRRLIRCYRLLLNTDQVRKTHFFGGRYENIYMGRDALPEILPLIDFWLECAAHVLRESASRLRCGFWFNEMQPGHRTLAHSHDQGYEKLSGVYYLQVPERSGELVLHDDERIILTPAAGELVLFAASSVHEVSVNKSREMRLSIGINFGPPHDADHL